MTLTLCIQLHVQKYMHINNKIKTRTIHISKSTFCFNLHVTSLFWSQGPIWVLKNEAYNCEILFFLLNQVYFHKINQSTFLSNCLEFLNKKSKLVNNMTAIWENCNKWRYFIWSGIGPWSPPPSVRTSKMSPYWSEEI